MLVSCWAPRWYFLSGISRWENVLIRTNGIDDVDAFTYSFHENELFKLCNLLKDSNSNLRRISRTKRAEEGVRKKNKLASLIKISNRLLLFHVSQIPGSHHSFQIALSLSLLAARAIAMRKCYQQDKRHNCGKGRFELRS